MTEAERYTEEADQIGLAVEAVKKLEEYKANKNAQTTSQGLGKSGNNEEEST